MRCSIFIGGIDKPYFDKLSYSLMHSKQHAFEITLVTTEDSNEVNEKFASVFTDKGDYHLCLFDEPFLGVLDKDTLSQVEPMLVLMTEAISSPNPNLKHLFKYQKAEQLIDAIYKLFIESSSLEMMDQSSKPTKVIGCYSPIGGAGTSTIAQIVASIKASRDKRILHIGTELFPTYHTVYSGNSYHNFSDYLAYIMKQQNWALGLEQMVSVDTITGIHYINPHIHMQDMLEVDDGLFDDFVEHIKNYSGYDYIVIDYSATTQALFMTSVRHCDSRIYCVRNDYSGSKKWFAFVDALKKSEMSHVLSDATLVGMSMYATNLNHNNDCDIDIVYDSELFKQSADGLKLNSSATAYRKLEVALCDI